MAPAEPRFNIETRTPTGYGELKTFIEGDFEGSSGVTPSNTFEINADRTSFSLRHAYGTLGPLLGGQYFSLFEDPAAFPETLDFGGAIGVSGPLRQPQIRYVHSMPNGFTIAGSLENPQTTIISTTIDNAGAPNGTSTFNLLQGEKTPDFVGALIYSQGPGHIALRGVLRDLYDHGPAGAATTGEPASNASALGWGAGIYGDLHVFGPDDIIFQANGGDGIGRYITNTGDSPGDAVISANGQTLKPVWEWVPCSPTSITGPAIFGPTSKEASSRPPSRPTCSTPRLQAPIPRRQRVRSAASITAHAQRASELDLEPGAASRSRYRANLGRAEDRRRADRPYHPHASVGEVQVLSHARAAGKGMARTDPLTRRAWPVLARTPLVWCKLTKWRAYVEIAGCGPGPDGIRENPHARPCG
jgi:hypothetical protein